MRNAALFALLLPLVGCASSKLTLSYTPITGTLGGEYLRLSKLEVEPGFYGRGCFDIEVDPEGRTLITMQQDGTTDWIIGRAAPGALREIAVGLTAFATKPIDIIGQLIGVAPAPVPKPSETHGCGGLFED